ncbi:MAG: class I SAM-dependent methyltransferase [Eubacteriaceae bacterium]|nr:class I SAM-dependent methyltransferase [Bacillota bacterium]MDD7718721.1 class I SAM-dependent methyltransferase [Eubacteriaceae bacterium]
MNLSDRLQLIADEIIAGETMADIGTDHGFLPLYLMESGKCPHVIMADISKGSLAKADENCKLAGPGKTYDLRLGDGIDVLEDGEVDVVAIAGMGGLLIRDILDWNIKKSRSFKRYIFQPRNKIGALRYWLYLNGFDIEKESLVREGKYICEVITVRTGNEVKRQADYTADFDYPDSLLEWKGPLTEEYLLTKLALEDSIYQNILKNSRNPETEAVNSKAKVEKIKYLLSQL